MFAGLPLLTLQGGFAPAPCPFDRTVELVLSAQDSVLEGHGPSNRIERTIEFSGTVHVWTKVEGDFDTFLRIEDREGKLLEEDDDSGGKPTPYVRLEVEPGTNLAIAVAASRTTGTGKLELHLVASPETETTRAEAERAKVELAEIKKLRKAKDLAAARARAAALVEHLVGVKGAVESELMAEQAWLAGHETYALAMLQPTESAWRLTLSHRLHSLPEDHPELQVAWLNLAAVIKALGDLPGARAIEEKVLEVRLRTQPDDYPDLQWARGNLANTLYSLGDLPRARSLQEKVLEVRTRTLPDDHPDLQTARQNLAGTLFSLGDLEGTRKLQEKVLEVDSRIAPDDHPELQKARQNLAVTIKSLGDLTGARALEEKVLEVRSRILPDDHPDLQAARQNLAVTIEALGDLAGARALEERVLEVYARTLPDDHPNLQIVKGNLAGLIGALGDLEGARALQEEVLEVRSRDLPDDHPDLQASRESLADTIKTLGDLSGARVLEEKALEIYSRTLPEDHPDLQAARGNLAVTIKLLGDLASARALEESVLDVRSRTLPDDHPALQAARQNLAITLKALGDLASARALEEKVLDGFSRTLPDDHPFLQSARQNLASTIAASAAASPAGGKAGKSGIERGREEFAAIARRFGQGAKQAALEAVLAASSREAERRVTRGDALDLALSMAGGYGVFASDPALEEQAFLLSESTRNVALLSARLARAARSDPAWEKTRSQMSEATNRLAALGQSGGKSQDFAAARTALDEAQRALVQIGARLDPGALAPLKADLAAVSSRLDSREALLGYRSYKRSVDGEDGKEIATQSLCAFVVRSGGKLTRTELGPIEPIERAVKAWREAVGVGLERGVGGSPDTQSTLAVRGVALRRLVLDPLREALARTERVVVALDDVLHLVPLEALPAGDGWSSASSRPSREDAPTEDSSLLGESVRFEPALNLLLDDRNAAGVETSPIGILLALGHPDFDRPPAGAEEPAEEEAIAGVASSRAADQSGILRGGAWERSFPTLPESRVEVRAIRDYYDEEFGPQPGAVMLERRRASREALVSLARRARWLHVATHGWFAPESIRSTEDPQPIDAKLQFGTKLGLEERAKGMSPMLLCGLALAGANLPENEIGRIPGLITAEEIGALDLSNCELAVLSACDTQVGIRRAGQGVASLQKALHMAGTRSVITSLWRVSDEATRELMVDFYRRIWVEKKPKGQALWEAKMKIRNTKDEGGKSKYTTRDWAAWVLTGDPR